MTDLYAFPENNKGRLVLDTRKKTLTTIVSTPAVDAPVQGEAVFFTRRLSVQPLTPGAP